MTLCLPCTVCINLETITFICQVENAVMPLMKIHNLLPTLQIGIMCLFFHCNFISKFPVNWKQAHYLLERLELISNLTNSSTSSLTFCQLFQNCLNAMVFVSRGSSCRSEPKISVSLQLWDHEQNYFKAVMTKEQILDISICLRNLMLPHICPLC